MEDLPELSRVLVRDVIDLAENVEAGPADPEHVASKAEELGVIAAHSDQDIDRGVTANLEEVVPRFSGTLAAVKAIKHYKKTPPKMPFQSRAGDLDTVATLPPPYKDPRPEGSHKKSRRWPGALLRLRGRLGVTKGGCTCSPGTTCRCTGGDAVVA
ncbi:hypothetical protein D9C73_008187 [Collichthys lucidus]|uniref:Uncharacterized protein n=1 Tax=Collichthys lucidus TaxID=240159 RepID=A0A4U5UH89_COLLU|nr:hypothetical protein D9C73_008187 [Collichthys lucidus]